MGDDYSRGPSQDWADAHYEDYPLLLKGYPKFEDQADKDFVPMDADYFADVWESPKMERSFSRLEMVSHCR